MERKYVASSVPTGAFLTTAKLEYAEFEKI